MHRVISYAILALFTFGQCLTLWGDVLLRPAFAASTGSLSSSLVQAYAFNPQLNADRARQRGTDENVSVARSNLRPRLSLNADAGRRRVASRPRAITDGRFSPRGYTLRLVQPLFRGFRTLSSIREADANILAGREELRRTEQEVLQAAITAHMDVIRDLAIIQAREKNVVALAANFAATEARFTEEDVTRTDLAQSRARLARARSDLNAAKSNLKASRAAFYRVVGKMATRLQTPRVPETLLPRTLNEALERGENEHPSILNSVFQEIAARYSIDRIRGEILPEINLEATYDRRFDPTPLTQEVETKEVRVTLSMPFYQGGAIHARVRQAKQLVFQRREEIENARRIVRADIVTAWGDLIAIRAQIVAEQEEVSANALAVEGIKAEEREGNRTLVDVLDAERDLINSEVLLLTSRRNLVVAAYVLLSATGRLDVVGLGLNVSFYDPELYYWDIKRKWFGFGPRLARPVRLD